MKNNINSENRIENSFCRQPQVVYIIEESLDELLQIGLERMKQEEMNKHSLNGTSHSRKSDEYNKKFEM